MTLRVLVEADGGSRGNPGPAGYGAVVREKATGDALSERKGGLGIATNNVAEYTGLVEGLRAAAALNASTVDVRLDSKLVVEQMTGRWKIKNAALRPLALEARNLAAGFDRVTYQWIPRAQNSHADRLANEAMDEQAGLSPQAGSRASEPPTGAADLPGRGRASPTLWTGAQGAPTRLFLLRHGQTEMSLERRYSGRGDVNLTDHGARQAAAAAKRLAALDPAVADAAGADTGPMPVIASPL
ncbi:MAG: reverse transcriptase-like protein, partial [Pseudonocardiaceae bacterium]